MLVSPFTTSKGGIDVVTNVRNDIRITTILRKTGCMIEVRHFEGIWELVLNAERWALVYTVKPLQSKDGAEFKLITF